MISASETERGQRAGLTATYSVLRPGDFTLGSAQSRAAARMLLTKRQTEKERTFRMILSAVGQPLDLAKSKCIRTRWEDGTLFEMVSLHGMAADLAEGELDAFVSKWPITQYDP